MFSDLVGFWVQSASVYHSDPQLGTSEKGQDAHNHSSTGLDVVNVNATQWKEN